MPHFKYLAIAIGMILPGQLAGPLSNAAHAAGSAKAAKAVPGKDGCYKKIGVKGRPHKLNTVASLSAVRLWSEKAKKHGEKYAMWHNALGSNIKCEKLPRSDYYSCFAAGKPCPSSDVADAKKSN